MLHKHSNKNTILQWKMLIKYQCLFIWKSQIELNYIENTKLPSPKAQKVLRPQSNTK